MIWVAIEDAETQERSVFVQATDEQVLRLMDVHKTDTRDAMMFCLYETEGDSRVVYDGAAYKGEFGYNILVAKKYKGESK